MLAIKSYFYESMILKQLIKGQPIHETDLYMLNKYKTNTFIY